MFKNEEVKKKSSSKVREFFSLKGVFTIRNISIMGMMVAVSVVLNQFSIYITPTFKGISFAYLPGVIVAMFFGPWAALIYAFVSDTINFLVRPIGFYFPGYTLSEMLCCFTYACFLYKQSTTVLKVVFARMINLVFVIFGLNFLWNVLMYGATASKFFSSARLINNLVQLPFHVLIICTIIKITKKRFDFNKEMY